MAAPALTAGRGIAAARVFQVSYDVASLSANIVRIRARGDTYALECLRELAKIRAALAVIEQHVAGVDGEGA